MPEPRKYPFMLFAYCTLEGEPSNHVGPFESKGDAIEFFDQHFAGEDMEYRVFQYSSPADWKK